MSNRTNITLLTRNSPNVEPVSLVEAIFIGSHPRMLECLDMARKMAKKKVSLLISGETGTGKNLLAAMIHDWSAKNRVVRVNIAAIPDSLLQSALFGHKKGAFTGAYENKVGLMKTADKGTLFLDEIGDLPIETQVKLLGAIEDKSFYPVGSDEEVSSDFRVIAATNRNLKELVKQGKFRPDLYYRVNGFEINIPPLRERSEDISCLADHFLIKYSYEEKSACPMSFSEDAYELLKSLPWPGNVRQLDNMINKAVILADARQIAAKDLLRLADDPVTHSVEFLPFKGLPLIERIGAIEKQLLLDALEKNQWLQVEAAKELGVQPRMIVYKMKKYGIRSPKKIKCR